MRKICDIHMHVIPGIDDGSKSINESLEMLLESVRQGVGAVIATPHSWAIDECGIDLVNKRFAELKQAASEVGIPVELLLGCEVLVSKDTIDECIRKLDDGTYPTMGISSSHVLTEFDPYWYDQEEAEYCVKRLVEAGYTPIIAHAERNGISTDEAMRLFKLGARIQVNLYSIADEPRKEIRETAHRLLGFGLVQYVGSDAHRMTHRPPVIESGIKECRALFSNWYTDEISVWSAVCVLY